MTDVYAAQGATILLALHQLTPKQRHAVTGRFWRDLTLDELGREMGVSRTAAGLNVQRSLERLATLLADDRETLAA